MDAVIEPIYYEIDEQSFGLRFPIGIPVKDLASKLKKANEKIRCSLNGS